MLCLAMSYLSNPAKEHDLEAIYYEYRHQMMAVAQSVLHDLASSEDAVQEALIRIAKNIDRVEMENPKRVRAYVLTITRNAALSICDKQKARREVSLCEMGDIEADRGDPIAWAMAYSQEEELRQALQKIPIEQAEVLMLKYAYGYKYKEIGKMLNRTEEAVEQQALRGKKKLRALLLKRGVECG